MRLWFLYTILTLPVAAGVTFTRDVAPILYQHCVACHHPNDIAPMSLVTYKDVKPWAAAIKEAVLMHKMPPWKADPSQTVRWGSASENEMMDGWIEFLDAPPPDYSGSAHAGLRRALN